MIKNTLNSKLFNELNKLKPEVLEGLRRVTGKFISELKESNIPINVLDCWIVGSNASYNYKPTSDIDIHIIANVKEASEDPDVLQLLYNYFKATFNAKYNITCKGLPVELYVEDVDSSSITNGVYSLNKNDWIKFPQEIDEPETISLEDSEEYKKLLNEYSHLEDYECEDFINKLYLIRKESLVKDGEFGEGNLIFKKFRDDGLLDLLKQKRNQNISNDLTVEALKEAIDKWC